MAEDFEYFFEKQMSEIIYVKVWGITPQDDQKKNGCVYRAFREELVKCAMQICHETGSEDTWIIFCAETVKDYLKVEMERMMEVLGKKEYENDWY